MFDLAFNSFVTLVVVVDPLGLAPIFAALTRGYSRQRKKEAAIRGTVIGAAIFFYSPSSAIRFSAPWASGFRHSGSRAAPCSSCSRST